MNGAEFKAGMFGQSLRINLFREHLGISEEDPTDLTDIICEDFYRGIWIKTATTNTETFDKVRSIISKYYSRFIHCSIHVQVFRCVPTDHCQNFIQLQEYQREHPLAVTNSAAAATLLKETVKVFKTSLTCVSL